MNRYGRQGARRLWTSALITIAVVLSAVGLGLPNTANAVTLGSLTSRMEIDGDKANGAGFDWNDIQDGTLPGGYVLSPGITSAGVIGQTYQIDGPSIAQSCGVQDADSIVPGSKLDDNPWPVQAGLPNSKNDICSGGAALEAINVNGAVHYLIYQYYTRTPDATGDQSVVLSLNGPLPGRCDDVLLDFNFGPSSGVVTTLYRWTPTAADACANALGAGSWGGTTIAGNLVQSATGANPELDPANANASTMGEFAVDLTAAGIMPENKCAAFTTGSTITYTGNSTEASLKDILNYSAPIVLDNCGSVSMAKATEPSGFGAGQNFTYKLDRTDGQAVHDSSLSVTGGGADTDASTASITSLIQTGQTHVWSHVLARPDYRLQETVVPANWQTKQIACSFWDPFFVLGGQVVPQLRTVTTATASLSGVVIPAPLLKPAAQPNTNCTITNASSGLRLVKAGTGDPNQAFNFTMTGQTVPALKLGGSADFAFAPGSNVAINETLPSTTPAWKLSKIDCKLADGTPVGTVVGTQVSVQTVASQLITCTYTNDQQARIVVSKTGTGSPVEMFGFEQSWDGNTTPPADFTLTLGTSTNSGDIAPGTYTVSELLPATTPAWLLNSIVCGDDSAGSNQSTTAIASPTATITLKAGDTVTCTFTNDQQGRLVLVKNTVGPDGTFSFSGPIASVTTTGNTGSVGLDVAPGTYPIAETVPAGWALTSATCDQGRTLPNVVVTANQTVTCTFNNTQLGKIVVTKQTLPDGSAQQFTFDGSWNGAGNDLTLTDGQSGDSGLINPGTYSVAETSIPAGWDLTTATCDDGSPVGAIVVAPGETVTCTFGNTQRGTITIDKVVVPAIDTTSFGFTFNGQPFGLTGAATPFSSGAVPPGTYVVTESAVPGWALVNLECVGQHTSTVGIAASTIVIGLGAGENIACTYTNSRRGPVTVAKTITNGPTLVNGNLYTVGYDLVVTSASTIAEHYNLSDALKFGAGTSVVSATLTNVDAPAPDVAGWDGVANTGIQNQAIINPPSVDPNGQTYHVTVTFSVAGAMTSAARDCVLAGAETGTGTLNSATVVSDLGSNTSTACGPIPEPIVTLAKAITAGPTRAVDGTWSIVYTVTVANTGNGPAAYSLNDNFGFGSGVTVSNVSVTTNPVGLNFVADNAGVTTSGTQLDAGATHTYTVSVTATIVVNAQTNGDCTVGGGFGNTASISTNQPVASVSVCAPFSTLTLVKQVVNNNGGKLLSSDVTLSATGPASFSGAAPAASAIPAGTYALAESAVPGYSTTGFDCGPSVDVAIGATVTCTIVNDDEPIDLQLTNSDGGAQPLAGEPFDYILT